MGLNLSKEVTMRFSTITGAILADAGLILILVERIFLGIISLVFAALFIGIAAALLRK